MNFAPPPRSPLFHPARLLLWLAGALCALPGHVDAAGAAPSGPVRPLQRLETPEDRAALTENINRAIEEAQARRPRRPGAAPPLTTLTVQGPALPGLARTPPAETTTTQPAARPATARVAPAPDSGVADPGASRRYIAERAAELAASAPRVAPPPPPEPQHIRWSYEGDTGPQAWGQLHPAFAACGSGRQQSPVHMTAPHIATGPAEPLQPPPEAFRGTVVHTGRGIELEVDTHGTLMLRGLAWRLVRVQFRHPTEERVHFKNHPMATDLLWRSAQGQYAVISVPMELGAANPFIQRVWTHLPLAAHDRVQITGQGLALRELLPQDLRYFQYLGSLTSPPCTEGVLRLVLQHPATVSRAQWALLTRMAPPNARPVQALHGRMVRASQ